MKHHFFYASFLTIIFSGFTVADEAWFSKPTPEEALRMKLEMRLEAEKPDLKDWHDTLVDLSKDMSKIGPKQLEMSFMRPVYRLSMYYSVLDTITAEDLDAVRLANAGTNTLNWCWNLLTLGCNCRPSIHLYKHDFASAWRVTDFTSGTLDIGVDSDSVVQRFFWFIGQAYAKNIWEDWYACWKNENQKEKKRYFVLKKLMSDFGSLEIFLLPYLYEALKNGDETLMCIIKNESIHPDPNNNDFNFIETKSDFFLWWDANKEAYRRELSADDGLKQAIDNAKKSIAFLGTNPREIELMTVWAREIANYYSKPASLRLKDYWYYRIGDENIEDWGDYYEAIDKSYNFPE